MTESRSSNLDPRIARTRQHALQATLELIAEAGLQGCTIETVSERSGLAVSTLYRHWNNKSELVMEALESQHVERVVSDTGNVRDDMLTAMLELGQALQHSIWGTIAAQLMAAATVDPEMARIQEATADYHDEIDSNIIRRAIERGEVSRDIDPKRAALLFSAPVFYRHLFSRQTPDAKWITAHVNDTVALLRPRSHAANGPTSSTRHIGSADRHQ